ncbi:SDR family NAD(P)-dependent oxidoreductase [Mesobacillus subterraneus]|uniref:SDR family oxidoreductase n=1 Tax=Mesobacillus subterraneus TaxID=285983 RepID=A0A3R9EC07_9BACI|nr:SDR family oxidoreductase [Mesobacillus subterraneus]RSD28453.1 SDR family oxidoreductase [Mesobacillus subterraneus]
MKGTALITGATSGLGYEFVNMFAQDGFDLVVVARNQAKLEDIRSQYPHLNVTVITKDLSKPNAAKEVYEEVKAAGITINTLVNNAGFGLMGNFDDLDLHKQSEMIQLNITALTELTHYFLPDMKGNTTDSRILNVASTAAFQPGPMMAVYYATKAYVLSFSEALAEELAGTNVTVTTLCPGATKTNFASVAKVEKSKMFSGAMSSHEVAKQGYQAAMAGKRVVITGSGNKAGAYAAKFLPRSLAAKIAKYVAKEA